MPRNLEELWEANKKAADEMNAVQKLITRRLEELEDAEGLILMIELLSLTTKFYLTNAEYLRALTGTDEGEYSA